MKSAPLIYLRIYFIFQWIIFFKQLSFTKLWSSLKIACIYRGRVGFRDVTLTTEEFTQITNRASLLCEALH